MNLPVMRLQAMHGVPEMPDAMGRTGHGMDTGRGEAE